MSFADPVLARRSLALQFDLGFDIRETTTALRYSNQLAPARRARVGRCTRFSPER
jgi:hypothetical protein